MGKWQRMDSVNSAYSAAANNRPLHVRRSGPVVLLQTVLGLAIFFGIARWNIMSHIVDRDTDAPPPSEAARAKAGLPDRERAVQTQPDNPWSYQERGEAYYNLGMYDKAIADLTKTISMTPHAESSHVYRARCYLMLKDYKSAIADYAATTSSKHPYFGYRGLGICYYHLGEYQKAVDNFTSALEVMPHNREILHDRGMAYQKLHLTDLANDDLNAKAIVNGPPIIKDIAPFLFPNINYVSKYWLQ
jgi:tetratricopeptide (TPR) repeat protein